MDVLFVRMSVRTSANPRSIASLNSNRVSANPRSIAFRSSDLSARVSANPRSIAFRSSDLSVRVSANPRSILCSIVSRSFDLSVRASANPRFIASRSSDLAVRASANPRSIASLNSNRVSANPRSIAFRSSDLSVRVSANPRSIASLNSNRVSANPRSIASRSSDLSARFSFRRARIRFESSAKAAIPKLEMVVISWIPIFPFVLLSVTSVQFAAQNVRREAFSILSPWISDGSHYRHTNRRNITPKFSGTVRQGGLAQKTANAAERRPEERKTARRNASRFMLHAAGKILPQKKTTFFSNFT